MSLTAHLKNSRSPICQFLSEQFPETKVLLKEVRAVLNKAPTLRPSTRVPYGTIGTALDYRVRYYFGIPPIEELVASKAAVRMEMLGLDPELVNCFRESFVPSLQNELEALRPVGRRLDRKSEERLTRYCVVLALFDEVFRAGNIATQNSPLFRREYSDATDLLAIAEPHWVDDLCDMSWLFYDRCRDLLSRPAVLNPVFDGSSDVGGADADIIVDRRLIEVKSTLQPNSDHLKRWVYQLLGYVLLDYSDRYRLQGIGFYFARQGVSVEWALPDLLSTLSGGKATPLSELRYHFRVCASRARGQP